MKAPRHLHSSPPHLDSSRLLPASAPHTARIPRTVPLADEPFDPRAETWTGLVTALRDPRQSSAEAARELEAAARVAEENIRRADERGAVDPAEGFAPTLGVGLVSCGGCGRIIALDALAKHRAGNCARARRLAGLERIAGALGAAPPPGPAIVEDDAPSPKKKAKVTTKKRTKEKVAEKRGVAGFRAGGLAAQIAPDLPPHLVGADADAIDGATTGATTGATAGAKTTTKTTVGTVAGADGTGAAPKRKRTSGAGSNRGKKAAAAAAGGGHFAGGTHAPYAGAHLSYAPPGYVTGVPGAPPGYVSAAGAGRAGHGGYSAAALARRLQQQRHARDAALAPAGAVVPLASPADPRKVRALRQRALYAMMFHESRDALVANIKPHVVAADVYLAGAKETVAPWPKRKQLSS